MFNESLARSQNDRSNPSFAKYSQPFTLHQKALLNIKNQNYQDAKHDLLRAKDNFKDFDLENRLHAQLRSALRLVKANTEDSEQLSEEELKKRQEKIDQTKNFYL